MNNQKVARKLVKLTRELSSADEKDLWRSFQRISDEVGKMSNTLTALETEGKLDKKVKKQFEKEINNLRFVLKYIW